MCKKRTNTKIPENVSERQRKKKKKKQHFKKHTVNLGVSTQNDQHEEKFL